MSGSYQQDSGPECAGRCATIHLGDPRGSTTAIRVGAAPLLEGKWLFLHLVIMVTMAGDTTDKSALHSNF